MWSVRDRTTFLRLRRSPVRSRAGPVTVTRAPLAHTDDARPAVAFAVGRTVGNAVVRNRLRRQSRECLRHAALPPAAYLVRIAPAATNLAPAALRRHLLDAISQLPPIDGSADLPR